MKSDSLPTDEELAQGAKRLILDVRDVSSEDTDRDERIWTSITHEIHSPRRRRRFRRATPALIGAFAMLAALGTVALAQSGVVGNPFRDDPAASANHVEAFERPRAGLSVGLEAFDGPVGTTDVDNGVREMLLAAPGRQDPGKGDWGKAMPEYLRTLLTYDGPVNKVQIFAMPTTSGNVCLIQRVGVHGAATTCTEKFDDTHPIEVGINENQGVVTVAGIASNDVAGVRVDLSDGRSADAVMGVNAFAWQSAKDGTPFAFTVKFTDGRSARFDTLGRPLS